MSSAVQFRVATSADYDVLTSMQALSLRELAAPYYGEEAIEAFIATGTMDRGLLMGGTYYLALIDDCVVGAGGWSTEEPGYATHVHGPPANDTEIEARVRSVYVHPDYARRGIASTLMRLIETDIVVAGFDTACLAATLSGLPLYRRLGWKGSLPLVLRIPGDHNLVGIVMDKRLTAANQ